MTLAFPGHTFSNFDGDYTDAYFGFVGRSSTSPFLLTMSLLLLPLISSFSSFLAKEDISISSSSTFRDTLMVAISILGGFSRLFNQSIKYRNKQRTLYFLSAEYQILHLSV